jgi:hypothetical protein
MSRVTTSLVDLYAVMEMNPETVRQHMGYRSDPLGERRTQGGFFCIYDR